jgi:hypothetical protein
VTVPSPAADEDDAPEGPTRSALRPPREGGRPDSAPQGTEEEGPGEEEERPRRRTDDRDAWRKVRLGLLVLMAATAAGILFSLVTWLGGFLITPSSDALFHPVLLQRYISRQFSLLGVQLFLQLLEEIALLTGYALCCLVPPRIGKRNLALAALVLGGIGLVGDTAADGYALHLMRKTEQLIAKLSPPSVPRPQARPTTTDLEEQKRESQQEMAALQQDVDDALSVARVADFAGHLRRLLHAAQFLAFAYFLRDLARSLGAAGTAANCLNLITLSAVLVVVELGVSITLGVAMRRWQFSSPRFFSVLAGVMMLLSLAQSGWFLFVVYQVRGLANEQLHRRARRKKPG